MTTAPTNEQMAADLARVARERGADTVSRPEYAEHGAFNERTVERRFGSWNAALEAAGLRVAHALPPRTPKITATASQGERVSPGGAAMRDAGSTPAGGTIALGIETIEGHAWALSLDPSTSEFVATCGDAVYTAPSRAAVIEHAKCHKWPRATDDDSSRICLIANDIHFGKQRKRAWGAFSELHSRIRPWMTIWAGDVCDFSMLSHWEQGPGSETRSIPEVKEAVEHANAQFANTDHFWIMEGNHDERFVRKLLGANAHLFEDALGITLREQFLAHGLNPRINWFRETAKNPFRKLGQFDVTHGHKTSGRFAAKHLAANAIMSTMGASTIRAHNHRAQMFCQTYDDHTAVAIASPTFEEPQDYQPNPNWQTGFTLVELMAPDYTMATAYPIVMHGEKFAWGGKTYGLREAA